LAYNDIKNKIKQTKRKKALILWKIEKIEVNCGL